MSSSCTKKKISIITPSVRLSGLPLVNRAIKRQTIDKNLIEWLICSPFNPDIPEAKWIPDTFTGRIWSINRAYNLLIKNCEANLIVSWQDYTFADADALSKFFYHFEREPNTVVGAVGNKYSDEEFINKVWQDPREINDGSYSETPFCNIEGNLCSVPKHLFYAIGGFDEELDQKFGMDFYSVMIRLSFAKLCKFKLNQTIKSYSLPHERPEGWDTNNWINDYEPIRQKYQDKPVLDFI
jgi:hypothetical protein